MANFPQNKGQSTMAGSQPSVIASDQSNIPISLNAVGFIYSGVSVNSSKVQLAANAIFTGVIEAIPNQPAFSILLFSSQPGTLTIRMFLDANGSKKCYDKVYTYNANSQFQVSAAANGNYFQCIYQNTGATTTTGFELSTAYGMIDGATVLNNKPHALYEINGAVVDSNAGNSSEGTQRVVLATNQPAIPITAPTITKGVQGSNGFIVQNLKDTGRTSKVIILDSFSIASTSETLMTMGYSTDNGNLTAGTSYVVTAGKRFCIQSITCGSHTIAGNTTLAQVIFRIRVNNSGTATTSSPVQFVQPTYGTASANQGSISSTISFPLGWEFVGGAGIGVTVHCPGFVATTAAPKASITINGYEY